MGPQISEDTWRRRSSVLSDGGQEWGTSLVANYAEVIIPWGKRLKTYYRVGNNIQVYWPTTDRTQTYRPQSHIPLMLVGNKAA